MATKKFPPTFVVTGKCRLSYAHIWEPSRMSEEDPLKYSACVIIPKSDKTTIQKIQTAVDLAVKDGIKSKWRGKKPANLKLPLRDGDEERPEDPAFKNSYFFNANSKIKPEIVDMSRNPIPDEDKDEVYSGCYCRFSINFYPFGGKQNGIAAGLGNVQKVCDGPRLGGGTRAEDDFDDDFTDDSDELDDIM